MKLNKVIIMESTLGAPDPMKAAYVKQCDVLQDRIDALESMLASLLDAIENANFIDYPVAEARALLEKE